MFKFFALCFLAIFAAAAAKPSIIAAPLAYSAPVVAAPYTAAYAAPYYSAYAAGWPYAAPYAAAYSAYSAYPYSPLWLRK